jgi:hypothetical protein
MVMDAAKIAQLEKELEEARDQLLREDGQRYRIIMREISEHQRRVGCRQSTVSGVRERIEEKRLSCPQPTPSQA